MTSLQETYQKTQNNTTRRKKVLSLCASGLGILMILFATVTASTNLFGSLSTIEAWQTAGFIGGFGGILLPLGGTFALPDLDRNYEVIIAGVALSVIGLVLFTYAFPNQWHNDSTNLSLYVLLVYGTGFITLFGYLVVSITTFKQTYSPDSSVLQVYQQSLNHSQEQNVKSNVEEKEENDTESDGSAYENTDPDPDKPAGTGVGFIGGEPRKKYDTQTNNDDF